MVFTSTNTILEAQTRIADKSVKAIQAVISTKISFETNLSMTTFFSNVNEPNKILMHDSFFTHYHRLSVILPVELSFLTLVPLGYGHPNIL